MNSQIQELAAQAGYQQDMFGVSHWDMPECRKFVELIKQAIYDEIKQELVDDAIIDAEPDIEDRCYLRGSNGGIVDALCIVKNFGATTVDDQLRNRSTYFGNDI